MIRVLHLLDSLAIGGKERAALRLARRATAEGMPAAILLFDTPYRHLDTEYECEDIPCYFSRRKPGLDFTLGYRIARAATSYGCRIVHAHNETALFYAALSKLSYPWARYRVVATIHTRPPKMRSRTRPIWRCVARLADEVVCVSDDLSSWLSAEGCLEHSKVIPGGVDLASFHQRPCTPPGDEFRVLTVGRLDAIKRQQDLIRAAQQLRSNGRPVEICIVGSGPQEHALKALATGDENIQFMGPVWDVASVLSKAHAFVLTSEHEGTPLALLEAMATGLPIVATAVGGVPRMVDHGVEALLVPVGRPDLIAAAIARLRDSPALCRELGERARQRSEQFSFEREWDQYRRIYAGNDTSPG